MEIEQLLIFFIIGITALLIWKHLNISNAARRIAAQYCDQQNVLLLDQSVILSRIRLCRSKQTLFSIERQYRFEFSTVGDARYNGLMIFNNKKLQKIEMDAFKI